MAKKPTPKEIDKEVYKCAQDPAYFLFHYCKILDNVTRKWTEFKLWPFQFNVIDKIHKNKKVVLLKSRQLGASWLCVGYALWELIFQPIARVLVFSKDDDAAMAFVSERMKGMWENLPDKFRLSVGEKNSSHHWSLINGSSIQSFSSSGDSGRSKTATLAILDESDWMPQFADLMVSVESTIADSGKIVILSTVDKSTPMSGFKGIYRGAKSGDNDFVPIFSSWRERPGRTDEWYAKELKSKTSLLGSMEAGRDVVWQEYPEDEFQALAPNSLDKRLYHGWLQKCFIEMKPMEVLPSDAPSIPGLSIYHLPERDPTQDSVHYVAGVDPAQGNPTSNDSAVTFLRRDTGEEVACLCGKIEPTVLAQNLDEIGRYYNNAQLMIERNNHGGTVLAWLKEHSGLTRLNGHDKKVGWNSSVKGKPLLYDICADAFRNEEVMIHTFKTITQLSTIEGNSGKAPEPLLDDMADSVALGLAGIIASLGRGFTKEDYPEVQMQMRFPKALIEAEFNVKEDEEERSYSEMVDKMVF